MNTSIDMDILREEKAEMLNQQQFTTTRRYFKYDINPRNS